jgi:hypothetical protein
VQLVNQDAPDFVGLILLGLHFFQGGLVGPVEANFQELDPFHRNFALLDEGLNKLILLLVLERDTNTHSFTSYPTKNLMGK